MVTTFVSLFGSARQSLNANTGRHLDFYYNDVLRLKPADFVADTAYVSFQLSPNVSSFPLDAGVQLDAGKDAKGVPIVFTTLQGANLCQIQVADVKNFSISRNPLIQPGTKELLITGIYTADNPAVPTDATWPVFGEDQVAYGDDQRTMQDAVLGFAFASKVLFMNSGNRSIQLNLFFTSESFQSCLMDLLTEIATINQQGHPSASLDAAVTTIFERVFCNGFRVDVTGKKNWLSLTVAQVTFDASAASISLFLDVPEGADPITAYDPKLHGAGYSTDYPLLRCLLVNQSPYAIYNFLNGLILKNACIEVNVTGCKDLVLYNQYGRIDSSKPFQPFGNQPERGTYFLLGNNEVFIKDSLSVKLYLEWINLPEEGFAEYYQEYGIEVTNTSYQVQFSYLRDSGWQQPRSMKSPFSLFTEVSTDSPTGPVTSLAEISEYDMEVPPETLLSAGISPDDLTIPLTYDQNTANGFFRMQLTAPSFGFGASLYNNVLSQTILNNTINKESNPLPNPPYTPMAGSVSMDYYAKDDVSFVTASHEREGMFDFYHIDAFTQYPITASATPSSYDDGLADTGRISNVQGSYKALLPSYASNGYLYLGLSNVTQAEPLSVLFYFTQKESGETANLPAVQWSYLLDNQWQLFQEGNTLHDETYSFSQSGIITFDLPQPDASVNTLMPPGLFWLRAEVPGNIDLFGDVSGIYAQVMKASYAPDYSNLAQRDSLVLPAGTIKRTIQNIPQIKSVSQPFSSFGGVLPETRNAFYTRISERLHHKHRAINAWDFERIALQAFPGIYKVKAFSNSSVSPGSDNRKVEIMVIPYMDANGTATTDIYAPVFGFMMLEQIKNYLQQYASPHLHINIRNPVYERLMVRCQVMFDNSSPFYIQKLNDDIAAYLSPWIDDNKRSVNSGDSIQKSSILGYIQQLDYVEFVTAFSIVKITNVDGAYDFYDTANDPYNSDLLYALTPWSVFVSAEQHLIDSIDVMKYEDPQPTGINDLTIGSDFIVVADKEPPPPSSPILLKSSGPPAAAPTPQQQSPRYLI